MAIFEVARKRTIGANGLIYKVNNESVENNFHSRKINYK